MNRQPVYHELDRDYRVVSRWSNRWVAQRKIADRGTREQDCWQDLHRPSTIKADAISVMNNACPLKLTKGGARS